MDTKLHSLSSSFFKIKLLYGLMCYKSNFNNFESCACMMCIISLDVYCYQGELLGITKFDMPKSEDYLSMLASIEQTADHVSRASVRTAKIDGTSECY